MTTDTEVRKPQGGDAVRLSHPWKWGMLEPGAIGVLQGPEGGQNDPYVDKDDPDRSYDAGASIVFNASTFRHGYVSSSGGPATIHTPYSELVPTDDTIEMQVWKWQKGMPGAGRDEWYKVVVPVWEWNPQR